MNLGFVGLGQMGCPMALNLVGAGYLTVFDRDRERALPLVARGARLASGLSEVAEKDTIFLSLPNSEIVEEIVVGEGGLIEKMKPGTVVVDTSTITYGTTLTISKRLLEKEVEFIDAPVSGMQSRAEGGTLTMMCGGRETVVERLHDLFSHVASTVLYMGQSGSGQLTKLINQLLFDINVAALAEILPMSVKLGLDPENIGEVVNSGTGRSYASEFFIPKILQNMFNQGYPMAEAYKDLISGADISARYQIPTPVLAAATTTYQQALLAGYGGSDKGAMIKVYEALLGVQFRKQNT